MSVYAMLVAMKREELSEVATFLLHILDSLIPEDDPSLPTETDLAA